MPVGPASLALDGRTDTTTVTGAHGSQIDNILLTGLIYESASDTLTAHAGGGQTNALQLVAEVNRITTVATSGDSVKLPQSAAGLTLEVINHGANPMQVYGYGTDTIDDVATATGVSQMPNSTVFYSCPSAGLWYTEGLATGFATVLGLATVSNATIAANATNSQAAGTPITTMQTNVTVGGANYSVTLPVSAPGLSLVVHNVSANSMNVYPNAGGTTTEKINAVSANGAYAMAANTSTTFTCQTAGQWYTVPRVAS